MNCPKCNTDLPEAAAFCWACGKKLAGERKHRKRSNGTGSITKLSGNRQRPWLARKSGIIVGTYPTRTEAQKALERLTDTEVNEKFNMTMQQIYDLWLPEHSRTISESQITNYRTAMKHCAPLHDRRWRSLRTSDFQSIIITMEQKGMSKSSCEKVLQLFGQLSDWAIREGIAQTNYAQFCTIVAVQKSEGIVLLPETITVIQQSTLPAADIALILLAQVLTGLGWFDTIAKFAGAGCIVPITGFANSVVAPAIEYKKEGPVLGVGAKLFSLAGPVLVCGLAVSVVAGLIHWFRV